MAQEIFIVKWTCDDFDFMKNGELIEEWRGHFKTREGAAAYIERTIAEENDEKDTGQGDTLFEKDPDDENRWTDGCESFFIETTELMD